jgi:glycosyltransferase involved in cell wall biosynthesis
MQSKKIKIIHFITTLGLGGAEKVLFNLLKNSNDKHLTHEIICLNRGGLLKNKFKQLKIKVICLNLDKNFIRGILNCFNHIRKIKNKEKTIIQTWLPHADLIGGLISKFCGFNKIIWNIRISNFTKGSFKFKTLLIVLFNGILSNFIPKKIISCSVAGIKTHIKLGYNKKLFYLIHNGFTKKKILKRSSKFSKNFTIGIFSRYHEVKNHSYLFRALSILKNKNYKFNLLLLGPNIHTKNKKLLEDIKINNIYEEVIFVKKQGIIDVSKYFSYLDLYVLCSKTEGFPNILGEAIINGIHALSTDVGDAKLILPSRRNIVHNYDVIKFSKKIENLVKSYSFKKSRNHILKKNSLIFHNKFSHNKMVYKYQKIWKSI